MEHPLDQQYLEHSKTRYMYSSIHVHVCHYVITSLFHLTCKTICVVVLCVLTHHTENSLFTPTNLMMAVEWYGAFLEYVLLHQTGGACQVFVQMILKSVKHPLQQD